MSSFSLDLFKKLGPMVRDNPKIRKALVTGGAFVAGAQGGPAAAEVVRAKGPMVLDLLAKLLGG